MIVDMFETYLASQGLQASGGEIIDATFVPASKQRIATKKIRKSKTGGSRKDRGRIQVD